MVSLCRRRRRFRTEYSWTRGRKGRAKWAVQLGSGKRAARMRRDWMRPGSSTGAKVGEGSGCAVQDRQALITPMPSSHGPQLCSAWCRGAGGLCWLQIPRQGERAGGEGRGSHYYVTYLESYKQTAAPPPWFRFRFHPPTLHCVRSASSPTRCPPPPGGGPARPAPCWVR